MDNQHNNGTEPLVPVPGPADAAPNAAASTVNANAGAEWNPDAPADPDEVEEHVERLGELKDLLVRVDQHVSEEYGRVLDNSDDDTDPPQTSHAAESSVQVDQAYELQREAEKILDKDNLTNQDVEDLEKVLDNLDSTINEATPLSFDPNAEPSPLL